MNTCEHSRQIKEVSPSARGCEECLQSGDEWTLLRMCLICGHVGCCDTSRNKHATQHFETSRHPVAHLLERDGMDTPNWCYVDQLYIK